MELLKIIYYALLYGIPAVLLVLALVFAVSVKRLKTESAGEKKTKATLAVIFGAITLLLAATAATNQPLYFMVLMIGVPIIVIGWFFISLAMYFDIPQGVDRTKEKKMLKISAAVMLITLMTVIGSVTAALVWLSANEPPEGWDFGSENKTQITTEA